jgi:hypothetical protein
MGFFGGGGGGSSAGLDPSLFLARAGGTMLGSLILRAGDPVQDQEAVPKKYFEDHIVLAMSEIEIGIELPPAVFETLPIIYGPQSTIHVDFHEQPANTVLCGPVSGADAEPTFRKLVAADIAGLVTTTAQTPWTGNIDGANHDLYGVHEITVNGNVNTAGQYMINGVPIGLISSLTAPTIVREGQMWWDPAHIAFSVSHDGVWLQLFP